MSTFTRESKLLRIHKRKNVNFENVNKEKFHVFNTFTTKPFSKEPVVFQVCI